MPTVLPGPMGPPAGAVPVADTMTEEHRVLLRQVMSLTPEQIQLMPPEQRRTVQQLRAQLGLPT